MEPFGDERADLRMGILASTVANIGTQGQGNFRPSDFFPVFGEQRQQRQGVDEMQAIMMGASLRAERAAKEQPVKPKPKAPAKRAK